MFQNEGEIQEFATATGTGIPAFNTDPYYLKAITELNFRTLPFLNSNSLNNRYHSARSQKDAILLDIENNVQNAIRFRAELGSRIFKRSAAVALSGVRTLVKLEYKFEDGKLTGVDQTFSNEGDGTVPFSSQTKYMKEFMVARIPDSQFGGNPPIVEHSKALEEHGTGVHTHIYRFMSLFYQQFISETTAPTAPRVRRMSV